MALFALPALGAMVGGSGATAAGAAGGAGMFAGLGKALPFLGAGLGSLGAGFMGGDEEEEARKEWERQRNLQILRENLSRLGASISGGTMQGLNNYMGMF